jgi:hypothetical protein
MVRCWCKQKPVADLQLFGLGIMGSQFDQPDALSNSISPRDSVMPIANTIAGCSGAGLRRLQETPSLVRGITHRARAIATTVILMGLPRTCRVLAACPEAPRKIMTDQLRSYPAAKAEIPELANVKPSSSKPGPSEQPRRK